MAYPASRLSCTYMRVAVLHNTPPQHASLGLQAGYVTAIPRGWKRVWHLLGSILAQGSVEAADYHASCSPARVHQSVVKNEDLRTQLFQCNVSCKTQAHFNRSATRCFLP